MRRRAPPSIESNVPHPCTLSIYHPYGHYASTVTMPGKCDDPQVECMLEDEIREESVADASDVVQDRMLKRLQWVRPSSLCPPSVEQPTLSV